MPLFGDDDRPIYFVDHYGADNTGVRDSTSAIMAAITQASGVGGGIVLFNAGTYRSGNVTALSFVAIRGAGMGTTTWKLNNSANTDLISAQTASINLSATNGTGPVGSLLSFSIQDISLNGNGSNQSSGPSWCLRFYGYNFLIENVEVYGGFSGGAQIDWNGGSFIGSGPEMESTITNCKFHDNLGIGLQMGGPHDSHWDNSLSFANTAHNFHIAPNANGQLIKNCHGYDNPNTTGIVNWLVETSGCQFVNDVAEGSFVCDFVLLGNNTSFVGGNIYNASVSSADVGMQLGQQAGNTPYPGQILQSGGLTTAVTVGNCSIQSNFNGYVAGAINFANESNNKIDANVFQTSGTALIGTPATSDTYSILVRGLTPDGSLGKGGGLQIASDATAALVIQSASGSVYTIDRFGNQFMSGGINTGAGFYFAASSTPNSLASGGTIGVQGLSDIVVAPTANVNGIIMQQGFGGQYSFVANASAFSIQFAVSGTSNMANGIAEVIPPNSGKGYWFNGTNNLWYAVSTMGMVSATAATIATNGTISTAGLDQSRVTTAGAVTGVILQAGTYANQAVVVVNESANSLTFAVVGTSNVADGTSAVIAANRMMVFRWDASTSKWYHA